jgi:NAD(P)-dependent dehydrogenase (short-subunit alcohol dehydrogenase family)
MNRTLENKVIAVTGGNGLLGRDMITSIKSKGGIAINLDLHPEDDMAKGLLRCDITDDENIRETFAKIQSQFGKIDGLVNNAYPRTEDWGTEFESIDPKSWRKNVDWQLSSHFVCCQEVVKYMKIKRYGSIVNIASIYGVVGNDFSIYEGTAIVHPAAYSAIKGGIINFSRYLASKYGEVGIRVNCISPGGIFNNQPESFIKAYEKKVPMRRLGKPDDIAPVVAFILSDEAKYITGQNLIVDGGWTAI